MPSFLYVGRLLYWKGLHLALRALAEVRRTAPLVRLTIIGDGPDRAWLESVAEDAGVMDMVDWHAAKPHVEVSLQFRENLALLFPSLHDSGGMVVLEALAAGVPVVSLDLGGPGAILTEACGILVKAQQTSEALVVASLAQAIILLASDASLRARLSANAILRARQMTWDNAASALYGPWIAPE